MTPLLRIGTRGSALALAQAREVRGRLAAAHPKLAGDGAVAIVVIRTTGDAVTDRSLASLGGKGLFTKEIEQALFDGSVDLAVHSMKDVPTVLPEGLVIDTILPREDPRDVLLSVKGWRLAELPDGAVIGTASLRRAAQLRHLRPGLRIVPMRGNVDTRLRKLADGVVDATLLAAAGLNRLHVDHGAMELLPPETMLPAPAQGAVGIERRRDDAAAAAWLAPLDDARSHCEVVAERALLAALDGSCRTPVAALARIAGERLELSAMAIKPDGSEILSARRTGLAADAAKLGESAGIELKSRAGTDYFIADLPEEPVR